MPSTSPHAGRRPIAAPWLPRLRLPRLRIGHLRLLAAVLAAGALVAGGWLVLRDSSLVAVHDVTVTGVSGAEAAAIREALTTAAEDMTTLDVQPAALRAAVARYPAVASLTAEAAFPHGLRIHVVQHQAVAALSAGGRLVPVAADGTLLPGSAADGLTTVKLRMAPAGTAITDGRTLSTLRLLALAPPPLRARVTTAFRGPDGLSVHLAHGPAVRFGPSTRLRAKWTALATVLSSSAAKGATAIDVRVPEHPAAAGLEQASVQLGQGSTTAGG